MKKTSVLILALLTLDAWAVRLSDYRPYAFEVLFTNPVCATYKYDRPVTTESGKTLTAKPKNVYCKPADESASVRRNNAPQFRIVQWISDSETKELYLAYLSFSSKNVAQALCSAVKKGVKLTLILDVGEDPANPAINKDAEALKKCGDKDLVNVVYRGSTGGLGFAHNKILMVNPGSPVVKILFSSGNMSGGTSINHENWNFVTTSGDSYFAQAHKCVVEAMVEAGDTRAKFAQNLNNCRSKIKAQPESDVRTFFAPVDGSAALKSISDAANSARLIEGMSHRLSGQLAELFERMVSSNKPVKFILDDDIYWSVKRKEDIGRNTTVEAAKIYRDLINRGMKTKFMETNQNVFQLQHNKFMIFTFSSGGAVFTGAGNFTSSAFTKNFENFYFITSPEVVAAYNTQFDLYYDQMATAEEDMPRDYLLP